MTQYPAITLSRSLGSGGTELGFLVARQLGWSFCDRRVLRLAAQAMGLSVESLARQEERPSGYLQELMGVVALGSPEAPYTPVVDLPVYSKELFAMEREVMIQMVERGPSVLVGRGGFIALKEWPATLHVKIHAASGYRVQSLVERGKAPDLSAAREAIEASDRDRAAFIRSISGLDWYDPAPFHLVLDVAKEGIEAGAKRVVEAWARRFKEPGNGPA